MNTLIAEAHAEDIRKVRQILRGAIAEAGDAWLSSDAVIDALTLELIEMAGRHTSPAQVAAHPTDIAAHVGRRQPQIH
jgi:hypothetical protein